MLSMVIKPMHTVQNPEQLKKREYGVPIQNNTKHNILKDIFTLNVMRIIRYRKFKEPLELSIREAI